MSVKTKITIARIKLFFTKKRYMGNHPKSKKFITVAFLVTVNSFILWNLSLHMPTIEVKFPSGSIVAENEALAKEIPEVKKERDLVDVIFSKESSRGVKNYSKCEAIGKFNRYGFAIPGDGSYVCFEKGEDTVAVAGWVAHRKALGWSDNQILCYYNSGKATEMCDYLK